MTATELPASERDKLCRRGDAIKGMSSAACHTPHLPGARRPLTTGRSRSPDSAGAGNCRSSISGARRATLLAPAHRGEAVTASCGWRIPRARPTSATDPLCWSSGASAAPRSGSRGRRGQALVLAPASEPAADGRGALGNGLVRALDERTTQPPASPCRAGGCRRLAVRGGVVPLGQ